MELTKHKTQVRIADLFFHVSRHHAFATDTELRSVLKTKHKIGTVCLKLQCVIPEDIHTSHTEGNFSKTPSPSGDSNQVLYVIFWS